MVTALARCGHRLGEPPRDGGDAPWTTQVIKVIIKCSCDVQNDFCGKREGFLDGPLHFEELRNRVISSTRKKNQTKVPTKHDSSELFHIDSVPSNVRFSQSIAMLHVSEDNEAVIKMII